MPNVYYKNVILFPKWKLTLEKESLQALKEKRYDEALSKLNKLISYQITNHEIIIGKLICLIELAKYNEAEELCESLIQHPDEHYYHYLHIYLTILFQTNQYTLLMDYVEKELSMECIPETIREQFSQLYDLSLKMKQDINIEKAYGYEKDLQEAFEQKDYQNQWRLIEAMRKMKTNPSNNIISYLKMDEIHPVIKTSIFHWLQDLNYSQLTKIHKFGQKLYVSPTEIQSLRSHPMFKQTMLIFNDLEQKNPTLYKLLEQLLYRYTYVRYPFFPSNDAILFIAQALKKVGEKYMTLHNELEADSETNVSYYIEEIEVCQTLYLSVIEE